MFSKYLACYVVISIQITNKFQAAMKSSFAEPRKVVELYDVRQSVDNEVDIVVRYHTILVHNRAASTI